MSGSRMRSIIGDLYNAALEEHRSAWRNRRLSISKLDQYKSLTALRAEDLFDEYAVAMQRLSLARLDDAFQAFFKRLKKGAKPGFPRFRSEAQRDSFGFSDRSGWKFDGTSIRMKAIGRLRVHLHRPIDGDIRSLMIKREAQMIRADWRPALA